MKPAEDYGPPALKIAGFQLWVHGRERPGAAGEDGDWLRVSAHCGARGASVWAEGSIIMLSDIVSLRNGCRGMLDGLVDEAAMSPLEPELALSIKTIDGLGHAELVVEITPDHLRQSHRFEFEIDQSYLQTVVDECDTIIRRQTSSPAAK
jgi:hypothetical protein